MAQMSPDKSVMRSSSEYVRSPAQQASKYLAAQAQQQTLEQIDAKRFLQQKEAQGLLNIFRERIELACEEDFDEWTVTEYKGDMTRKAFAKVRVNDAEFIHVHAIRTARDEPWICRYAKDKTAQDPLEQSCDDYESLPETDTCGGPMQGACSACSLM
mmetsp:Transcript_78210/g.176745  ORF Transcript_78210/g.176745 Transcript_78210/m.176745 type:complete len:157 (+) Transcript_78210:157-627(+)